eukprot:Skav203300  [mRNA]  locus=scaffold2189:107217:107507:+ [translate_table: standard]
MSKIQMLLLVLGCCVFAAGALAMVSHLAMAPAVLVTGNMLIALSRLGSPLVAEVKSSNTRGRVPPRKAHSVETKKCKKSKDESEDQIMDGLEVFSF